MMIYNVEQQRPPSQFKHEINTKFNEPQQQIQNSNNIAKSEKFSSKCLIIISSIAIVIIGICAIFIAVLASRFFIINKNSLNILNDYLLNSNINVNSNNNSSNNVSERNSFNNWIKNKFNQKIFGFNFYDNSENDLFYPGIYCLFLLLLLFNICN